MATFELTEGKLALTMTDGKVTGFTASGKGPVADCDRHRCVAGRQVMDL
jgi:hypothetical protein